MKNDRIKTECYNNKIKIKKVENVSSLSSFLKVENLIQLYLLLSD